MDLKSFARIDGDTVAEIFKTAADVGKLFHPSLIWQDVTDHPEVCVGWKHDGASFSPPTAVDTPAAPSLADLQAQLLALQAQIGRLTTER